MTAPVDIAALVADLASRKRLAVARAITLLETLKPEAAALLTAIRPRLGHSAVIGFTGPPGAGKSTLVNATLAALRARDMTVAVIAVDPSSPVSGGAILGDRIRMTAADGDDGVFVRSLSSGTHVGGLTPAAVRIIDALDAAHFDVVILETVGTGQSELDVAEIADVRIVVAAPGLGDDIQAMKSGHLEIADAIVVTKSDLPGAARTRTQLAGAVSVRADGAHVPVLACSGLRSDGIAELVDTVLGLACSRLDEGIDVRRRRRARYLLARAAADLVRARIREGAAEGVDDVSDRLLAGELTPREAAERLLR